MNEEKEPYQKKSLFHTRCKCENKCCDVIIDSGSTDNLVFEEMVTKLKLKRERHPQSYRIAWLQNDHKILVNEQCLVQFKIESYRDEVLCDIIPMDACHVLLGRPCKFDRRDVHDGRANTYTLTKDGVLHKLKPLKEVEENVCSNGRICFVDGRIFLEGMKHEPVCFALILRVDKEHSEEVLVEVSSLLNEFQDIVSDNVPKGLPPVRKISHRIDLILGASLPNKATHKMKS
ncbi:uncharacterized protein LOC131875202 [Cryptomeria japonica]|uniref:uncharacterized protein LOC131875202 n=1 Tax=Cryptomeria japonica TaxID=3369 RepID=UPI0027DA1BA5|nr:uncharacterized protein LOC131875202 [Cryptomeria japonica]